MQGNYLVEANRYLNSKLRPNSTTVEFESIIRDFFLSKVEVRETLCTRDLVNKVDRLMFVTGQSKNPGDTIHLIINYISTLQGWKITWEKSDEIEDYEMVITNKTEHGTKLYIDRIDKIITNRDCDCGLIFLVLLCEAIKIEGRLSILEEIVSIIEESTMIKGKVELSYLAEKTTLDAQRIKGMIDYLKSIQGYNIKVIEDEHFGYSFTTIDGRSVIDVISIPRGGMSKNELNELIDLLRDMYQKKLEYDAFWKSDVHRARVNPKNKQD